MPSSKQYALKCPECRARLKFTDDRRGAKVACPKCKSPIVIPKRPASQNSTAKGSKQKSKPGQTSNRKKDDQKWSEDDVLAFMDDEAPAATSSAAAKVAEAEKPTPVASGDGPGSDDADGDRELAAGVVSKKDSLWDSDDDIWTLQPRKELDEEEVDAEPDIQVVSKPKRSLSASPPADVEKQLAAAKGKLPGVRVGLVLVVALAGLICWYVSGWALHLAGWYLDPNMLTAAVVTMGVIAAVWALRKAPQILEAHLRRTELGKAHAESLSRDEKLELQVLQKNYTPLVLMAPLTFGLTSLAGYFLLNNREQPSNHEYLQLEQSLIKRTAVALSAFILPIIPLAGLISVSLATFDSITAKSAASIVNESRWVDPQNGWFECGSLEGFEQVPITASAKLGPLIVLSRSSGAQTKTVQFVSGATDEEANNRADDQHPCSRSVLVSDDMVVAITVREAFQTARGIDLDEKPGAAESWMFTGAILAAANDTVDFRTLDWMNSQEIPQVKRVSPGEFRQVVIYNGSATTPWSGVNELESGEVSPRIKVYQNQKHGRLHTIVIGYTSSYSEYSIEALLKAFLATYKSRDVEPIQP